MNELATSYRWCQQVCRRSGSSFRTAFNLLTAPRRDAMYALYAFARLSDDLCDSSESRETRFARLESWRESLQRLSDRHSTGRFRPPSCQVAAQWEPLWPALADSLDRYDIPFSLLEDIVHGVSLDIDPQHIRYWDQLESYCYYVASAVGLACVSIWKESGPVPRASAVACGLAFQLTNILRDVAEDARLGRLYVPSSLLHKHGVDRERWLAGSPNAGWEAIVDEVASIAYDQFQLGWETVTALTKDSQRTFSMMWRGYRMLLDQVVENKDRLWHGARLRLPLNARISLAATHYVSPLFDKLPDPAMLERPACLKT